MIEVIGEVKRDIWISLKCSVRDEKIIQQADGSIELDRIIEFSDGRVVLMASEIGISLSLDITRNIKTFSLGLFSDDIQKDIRNILENGG